MNIDKDRHATQEKIAVSLAQIHNQNIKSLEIISSSKVQPEESKRDHDEEINTG